MKNIVIISESSKLAMMCKKIRTVGYQVYSCADWIQVRKNKYRRVDFLILDIENYAKKKFAFSLEVLKRHFNEPLIFLCCPKKSEKIEKICMCWGFAGVIYFSESANSIHNKLTQGIKSNIQFKSQPDVLLPPEFQAFVGMSKKIVEIKQQLFRLRKSNAPVLLLGETGSGKTLCAQILQKISVQNNTTFIQANMARFAPSLCESELFGSSYGAFTGAIEKPGLFEKVNGGTLFLDEIGTIPLEMQAKMLRVLEEGKFSRVGETRERRTNVRLISATNLTKEELHNTDIMRQDFLYRIAGYVIEIPPLREHKEDIPLLIINLSKILGIKKTFSVEAMKKLMDYNWKGNVRELKKILHCASLKSEEKCILSTDFSFV
ncbi:MAG: hypothetical protein BKP49_07340 [Treponema sp. CETP13]|nr:MAG: hypothetical protein BKP49_07340 [Treponema sp. CETP13]